MFAAASSRARGRPSRRRQIAATVAAFASSRRGWRPPLPLGRGTSRPRGTRRPSRCRGRPGAPADRARPRARPGSAALPGWWPGPRDRDSAPPGRPRPARNRAAARGCRGRGAPAGRRGTARASPRAVAAGLGYAEGRRDVGQHDRRLATAASSTTRPPPGNPGPCGAHLECEPGLPHPAGTGQRDQPVGPAAEGAECVELRIAAEDRRRGRADRGESPCCGLGGAGGSALASAAARHGRRPATPQWNRPDPTIPARHRSPGRTARPRGGRGRRRGRGPCAGRAGAVAPLEGSHGLHRHAGAFGELLLGQRPRLTQPPQQVGEVVRLHTWGKVVASPRLPGPLVRASPRWGAGVGLPWVGWHAPRREAGTDGIRPPRQEERP